MDESTAILDTGQAALPELAGQINEHHARATEAARTALEHARECGAILIQAKAQVGHGGFLAWLAANCRVGERQARRYMRVAENWPAIEAKSDAMSDLTVTGALRLLADGDQMPPPQSRTDNYALPFGFTWSLESDHVAVSMPSGCVTKLRMTGAEFPDVLPIGVWDQLGYTLHVYGQGLLAQLTGRTGEAGQ